MGSRSYNHYNPSAPPNSSMNGGPPPEYGYPPFPAHGPSQGGPPPPDDGAGRYYPPSYPAYPAPNHGPMPPRSSNSGLLPMMQYKVRQKVSVRLSADTWVVGIIVGIVHLASMITGRKYQVEFESINGSGRHETREFFHEELVPYRPGG